MIAYLDTSAAVKILKDEPDSDAVKRYLNGLAANEDSISSSTLLETELRRAAVRQGVSQTTVTAILDRLDIVDLSRSMFREAGVLAEPSLRSLDALHLVAALRVGADVLISYDQRQIEAAQSMGIRTLSPG
jgi:predicted nucleic acid-binding protein